MRRTPLLILAAALVATGACGTGEDGDDGRIDIVTTLAPITELAERIGGDGVRVHDITPAGGEPHDLELSTDDVDLIEDADLVLYVGGDFQPAVERVVGRAERAVDLLEVAGGDDPHVWLDPVAMAALATAIADAVAEVDPAAEADGRKRAQDLRQELEALHVEIEQGLASCERRLVVSSHRAFARFVTRYGLEQEAIADHSAEAEPDAARLAEVADLVRSKGATTVFGEPGAESDVAQAVAREAKVEVATLDPIERRGTDYLDSMRANLAALRTGLGCR